MDGVCDQPRKGRPQLRLTHVLIGSMIADMIVIADTAVTLYDFSALARKFCGRLIGAAKIMAGLKSGTVTSAERAAVDAMCAPIASDDATQVILQVVGDNNNVFVVTPELAEKIIATQRKKPRTRTKIAQGVGTAVGTSSASAVGTVNLVANDLVTGPPHLGRPSLQVHGAVSKSQTGGDQVHEVAPNVLGDAYFADGRWWVRLWDDPPLPLVNEADFSFWDQARTYRVGGFITMHGDRHVGFRAVAKES